VASNTIWQQSEKLRTKKFPEWMESDFKVLSDFISKNNEVEMVGERDYRIPFKKTFGGRLGHYDPQLGDMGRGSSPTGNVMFQSFYSLRLNFEFDELQIAACENKSTAVQNPFLQCVADGIKEFALYWDKIIHSNGTAQLATAIAYSNSTGVTVYTMEDGFGTQLLRIGQYFTVYDSSLTTVKSNGTLWAQQIGTKARTLTLSGIVPNAAATDVICFEGVSGSNPAGPRGLKYWISNAASGATAGINRALENQIISKSVDGTNGLTTEVVMALQDQIQMDRGEVPNLMGVCAPAQRAYAYTQMIAIQMDLIEGDKAGVYDRLPKLKGKKFFMWGDVPHYVDIHQDAHTNVYIVPSDWGTARLGNRPPGFYETPGKSGADARFYQLAGASGGPAAGVWFGFQRNEDLYCINPGQAGVIPNLPLGALYA
jgi:hypothetical protein